MMTILYEACLGGLMLCGKLIIIVVPLVAIFEVLRYVRVFRDIGSRTEPAMRCLGLGKSAVLPLFTGIFLGIAYGAGTVSYTHLTLPTTIGWCFSRGGAGEG